ncbi:MAG: hypothetical protein AAGA92_13405 [Planctomycetota bacterium]
MRGHIVYFARRPNDLDHVVPVLWNWLERGAGRVDVVPIGNPSLAQDPRLRFLERFEAVKVWGLGDLVSRELYRPYERYWQTRPSLTPSKLKRAWNRHVVRPPKDYGTILGTLAEPLLRKFADKANRSTVLLDWACDGDDRLHFDNVLHSLKDSMGFTTVAMPHGDEPHHTALGMTGLHAVDPARACVSYKNCGRFDYVVAPNEPCATRFRGHVPDSRLKVLGSARFSRAWVASGASEVFGEQSQENVGRPFVVMFLRDLGYPVFWEEVLRTFDLLSHSGARLIVQRHLTDNASRKMDRMYPGLRLGDHGSYAVTADPAASGWLASHAAAVIDLGTSICFESVRLGVPVISPEYLHATHTWVSLLMPSTRAYDRCGLLEAVQKAVAAPGAPNYSPEERRTFVETMLDVPDEHVLERHTEFLLRSVQQRQSAA